MFRFKRGNCLSVLEIVKKELVCHIANLLELFLILKSIIVCSVCSFFTISYIRVFHRLKRNIFMATIIRLKRQSAILLTSGYNPTDAAILESMNLQLCSRLASLDPAHFRMHFEQPAFGLFTTNQNKFHWNGPVYQMLFVISSGLGVAPKASTGCEWPELLLLLKPRRLHRAIQPDHP